MNAFPEWFMVAMFILLHPAFWVVAGLLLLASLALAARWVWRKLRK